MIKKILLTILTASLLAGNLYADGIDSNAKLVTHLDTDFSDSSASAHTPTTSGSPTITAISPKFGAGAGLFASALSQYVSYENSSDWNFGTGDFTVDMWVNFTTVGNYPFMSRNGPNSLKFQRNSGNIRAAINGNAYATNAWVPNQLQYYHLAMVRFSGTVMIFIDGVKQATTGSSSDNISDSTVLQIAADSGNGEFCDCRVDEVRISNVARWTVDFTPPTSPYSSGSADKKLAALGVG